MSDIREFPIGEGERMNLLVGPCDVIAVNLRRIADIEDEMLALAERIAQIDREGAE